RTSRRLSERKITRRPAMSPNFLSRAFRRTPSRRAKRGAPVTFGPAAKTVASAGTDGRIIVWDVAAGDKLREWRLPGPVWDMALAPHGRHLSTADAHRTADT